jgi:ribosomal protein S18 acetylase RimI-like enzyme
MVFWKRLFTNSDAVAVSETTKFAGELVKVKDRAGGESLLLFNTEREIDLYELEELCDSVGWARRPLRKVKKAIECSFLVVSLWEMRGNRRVLIGFARATSDQSFNATIWDVVVHPRFQNQGLGKTLMQYIIKKLRSQDISNITLFADPQVVEFYRRLGFVLDPEGIKGMFWYPQ